MTIELNKRYHISKDLITREIEGELVIVPLKSGLGNLDSEMFALNKTGISIWQKLDGTHSIDDVIKALAEEYDTPYRLIKEDVMPLLGSLIEKGLVVES